MENKQIQEAFSHLRASEHMTRAVLDIPAREADRPSARCPGWVRYVAAAAVLAMVIGALAFWPAGDESYVTGPGLLSITAYALDENEINEVNSTVLKEGVELPWEYVWSPAINIIPVFYGMPLKLDFPSDEHDGKVISLEIRTNGGSFYGDPIRCYDPNTQKYYWSEYQHLGDAFTISNNSTIYWNNFSKTINSFTGKEEYVYDTPHHSYVDIVIRADDTIVGYAVVEIYEQLPKGETTYIDGVCYGYLSRVVKIVSFPKVDGNYQFVTERYVNKQFEKLHQDG